VATVASGEYVAPRPKMEKVFNFSTMNGSLAMAEVRAVDAKTDIMAVETIGAITNSSGFAMRALFSRVKYSLPSPSHRG
jgi:hypothetical protein